ncbi:MAG: metal ABC transporter ATP-binding protein [Candidatus Microgenomates bacterium]|jgi:zinc transport system ATP-binding protein
MSPDHSKNIIEIKNISYEYDEGDFVLKDVSLNIHPGDYIGLIGPNGGGKTTLIKLILGLLKIQSGEINFMGKPNIAYVPQKATDIDQRFPVSVEGVIAMGRYFKRSYFKQLTKTDKDIIHDALEKVGMLEFKNRLIGNLSGGQQQRTFIARALAQEPQIIFLDEPTSGVDEATQEEFYKILKKLNQDLGITLILISHDVDVVAEEVTEIACLNQQIVFYGLSKEFIKEEHLGKLYSKEFKFITRK